MAQLLTGKEVVESMNADLIPRIDALRAQGIEPTLALLRVGERPDDLSYERTAKRRADDLGLSTRNYTLAEDAGQELLEATLADINEDEGVHGCLMFRPLPKHFDEQAACDLLAAHKDVDGVSSASLAAIFSDKGFGFAPCTAAACMQVLDHYQVPIAGKKAVVIGRSLVIGKPVAMMLLRRNATVTICHSRTEDLPAMCRQADIVVCATGRPRMYGEEYFRAGQCVIDVGINFDEEGTLCGDVDFESVAPIVAAITPVPGGIGSVTTAEVLAHTVRAAERFITDHQKGK